MENSSLTAQTATILAGECKMSRQRAMAHRIAPTYRRAEPSVENTSLTLLNRASLGSSEAWEQLDSLYRPFIARWFRRQNILPADADDLTQDVLAVVVRDLTKFDHNGRTGAFRAWVRGVCLNRAKGYRRKRNLRESAAGGTDSQRLMNEVADSPEAADWDREHDQYILQRLFDQLTGSFEEATMIAFRRLTFEGATGQQVATELNISVAAVFMAKSRVLRRLRELAEGLVDDHILA
jgi:RNA polymerase sigma-70 factor (ECF subfamily)